MANKYLLIVGFSSYIAAASSFSNLDTGIEIRDRHATIVSLDHDTIGLSYCEDITAIIAETQDFKFGSPLVGFVRLPEDIASATCKPYVNVARGPPKSLKSDSPARVTS